MRIEVIQGANLNLLGRREPQRYGFTTLRDIDLQLSSLAAALSSDTQRIELGFFQSNHEGQLVDKIQSCLDVADGIIINPGGYTHTSVAIRDALLAVGVPTIEVHLTNPAAREEFRHRSFIADVVRGSIVGLGAIGYQLALRALVAAHSDQRAAAPAPTAAGGARS